MPTFKARALAAAVVSCAMFLWLPPAAMAQARSAAANPVPLAVTAQGAWSATVNYVLDDLVTSRGSTWRAKRANLNKVPGSTSPSTAADWELFAAGLNPLGGWQSTTTYHRNDLVSRSGTTWRAKRTSLNAIPGSAPVDWQSFAARGAVGAKGATGATGPAGPNTVADGTAGAPSISFSSDPDTGMFSPGTGKIALAAGGSLFLHNIGSNNAALGSGALALNASGFHNTALGQSALAGNTDGFTNTAIGSSALLNNSTGSSNTAVGAGALQSNTTSSDNIAVGILAGSNPTASTSSIFIGNAGLAADTATIKIGGSQTRTFIAGIRGRTTAVNNAVAVLIDSAGQLGTVSSSRRYKEDIQSMGDVSKALLKLRPVTFRYKTPYADGGKPIEYGLIAEEVAEVLPDLAVFNDKGQPETVKYHLLPAFLLNEYQQQQKTIEMQAEQMAAQERRLISLEAQLARLSSRLAAAQPVTLSRSADAR